MAQVIGKLRLERCILDIRLVMQKRYSQIDVARPRLHPAHARKIHGVLSTGRISRAAVRAGGNKSEVSAGKLKNSEKMTSERVLAPKRRHSSLKQQEIRKMRTDHGILLSSSCQCGDGVSPVTMGSPRDRAICRQEQYGDSNSLLLPLAVGGPRTLGECRFARFTDGVGMGYSPLGPRFLARGMRDIPVGTCLGPRSTMSREEFYS